MRRILPIVAIALLFGLCGIAVSKTMHAVWPKVKPAVGIYEAINLAEQHLKKSEVDLSNHYAFQVMYLQLPNEDQWCWRVIWIPTGKGSDSYRAVWHHVAVYMDKKIKHWAVKPNILQ